MSGRIFKLYFPFAVTNDRNDRYEKSFFLVNIDKRIFLIYNQNITINGIKIPYKLVKIYKGG